MSGEDQERFEDYLELEHYLEELQAGHVAHPPAELTPEQARIYRMAALFRSASPEAAEPRPEFAAELKARLDQEIQQQQQPVQVSRVVPLTQRPAKRQGSGRVSRRFLLAGGAAVAASLVAGAAIDHVVEEQTPAPKSATSSSGLNANTTTTPLVPSNIPSKWLFVTTLAQLGNQAVRFASETVVGFVLRYEGDSAAISSRYNTTQAKTENGQIIAMSAACTHMGCLVHWQNTDRTFHCPCHGGVFNEAGDANGAASAKHYLQPLPRLETKIENGNVYVKVPG
jgi:Rieske Fe-S protein